MATNNGNEVETQISDPIPEGMIVEDGVVIQDAPVRQKPKIEMPESSDRETNEILKKARRPTGVARVDANGQFIGDGFVDDPKNDIFKSKDFLEAFGAEDVAAFMNQRRGPKNIKVVTIDSRPADTGNPNLLNRGNRRPGAAPTVESSQTPMPVKGNIPRGPENF